MTPEEVTILLNVAPFERAMLYEVALSTGLRANELRNLTLKHLDVERSGLRLDAAWTKNCKPGFQPIPSGLVNRLLEFVGTGIVNEKYKRFYSRDDCKSPPQNRLLYIFSNPTKAFDEDIEAAGIPKKPPRARSISMHSALHTQRSSSKAGRRLKRRRNSSATPVQR
jgi:integrase